MLQQHRGHAALVLVNGLHEQFLGIWQSQPGPDWESFSALDFHALDRPTLVHD